MGVLRRLVRERGLLALKCALAAGAAWLLALALLERPAPYYAPLVAFLMIQPTVAASARDGLQYLAAAVVGVGVALGTAALLGASALGIALTVGTAVLLGGLRWLGSERVTASFWALFTVVVGGDDPTGYVVERLPEAVLGGVTGLAVNLLVLPPLLVRPAAERLQGLRAGLSDELQAMADDLAAHWPPEREGWGRGGADALVHDARAAVAEAGESTRFNPRGRRTTALPRRQREDLEHLEQVALGVRALARLLHEAASGPGSGLDLAQDVRPLLVEHLGTTAALLRGDADSAAGSPEQRGRLRQQVSGLGHVEPASWLAEGALVVHLEQVVRAACELSAASRS